MVAKNTGPFLTILGDCSFCLYILIYRLGAIEKGLIKLRQSPL